jgi:hypothetical protein
MDKNMEKHEFWKPHKNNNLVNFLHGAETLEKGV